MAMLTSFDNFVLQIFAQIIEVVAVTGYPYNQVAIHLRMLLRVAKRIGIHHIKLNMVTIEPEITPHQRRYLTDGLFIIEETGGKFLV